MTPLPDFERPPVVEMACGVQFRPLEGLRGMARFPIYEQWRAELPQVSEQPVLAPVVETGSAGTQVQIQFGAGNDTRHWFTDAAGRDLVQLQQDRLIVNWREGSPAGEYPRYAAVRENLARRLSQLSSFLEKSGTGKLEISRAEISYINAISPAGALGDLADTIEGWPNFRRHHLGRPDVARTVLEFPVPGVGLGSRLTVSIGPGMRMNGEPALFMSMSLQGPTEATGTEAALAYMDQAHANLVRSFAELTTDSQHQAWGRRA